jgi:2-alkyl-3-oxoalkanoate reductase
MRILVTGGTGFTGTALVKRLRETGHDVVALDYKEGLACDGLRAMGVEVVIGSVTDPEAVRRSMRGVEYVFHLAAAFRELNVPNSFYDQVNVEGTRNVLEAAIQAGVWKFVYCSTCGVHGNVDHPPAN